jgi:DNA-binding winged helix-turn-helix (wHTH) protein
VHVEPQVFDVLARLVEHRDRVVPKAELLDVVWGHQLVSESALTTRIKQLRHAVGDSGRDQRIVQTVHGRGYRFVAPVEELADATERVTLPVPGDLRHEIRVCTTSDGTRLVHATVGSGPPLVRAAHWITHLAYDWQSPVWRHWLVGLARQHTLVRYDERGCGLSDHDVKVFEGCDAHGAMVGLVDDPLSG